MRLLCSQHKALHNSYKNLLSLKDLSVVKHPHCWGIFVYTFVVETNANPEEGRPQVPQII